MALATKGRIDNQTGPVQCNLGSLMKLDKKKTESGTKVKRIAKHLFLFSPGSRVRKGAAHRLMITPSTLMTPIGVKSTSILPIKK